MVLLDLRDVVNSKCLPPDFQIWIQCFCLYTVVLTQDKLLETMAYQSKIAKYLLKYCIMVVYNINYQQAKALNPEASWALADGDLFAESFTGMMKDHDSWCH